MRQFHRSKIACCCGVLCGLWWAGLLVRFGEASLRCVDGHRAARFLAHEDGWGEQLASRLATYAFKLILLLYVYSIYEFIV